MAAGDSRLVWTVPQVLISTNLESLGAGDWWASDVITDAPPTHEFCRVSYYLVGSGAGAGDFVRFKLLLGDGGAPEIWSGSIGAGGEAAVTTAGPIALLNTTPSAEWSHTWETNHTGVFEDAHTVSAPGQRHKVAISPNGFALSTGNIVRIQYGTRQLQS